MDRDDQTLARVLVAANLAQPVPPARDAAPDTTVVIPVGDRAQQLHRLLATLGAVTGISRVVVVDDGSATPDDIGAIAQTCDAELIRRRYRGGAPAARNDGLAAVRTPLGRVWRLRFRRFRGVGR